LLTILNSTWILEIPAQLCRTYLSNGNAIHITREMMRNDHQYFRSKPTAAQPQGSRQQDARSQSFHSNFHLSIFHRILIDTGVEDSLGLLQNSTTHAPSGQGDSNTTLMTPPQGEQDTTYQQLPIKNTAETSISENSTTDITSYNKPSKGAAATDDDAATSNSFSNEEFAPPLASLPSTPSKQRCHSLACRTFQVLVSPYIFGTLALALLYFYIRRRSRRLPSQGAYRAVAAQYVNGAFDEELSPEDYMSDDEGDEFWTHGKKTIEMGTFQDDLTLDEVNG
jgi:hypothetical protein